MTYLRWKKRCAIALSSCPLRGSEGAIRLLPSRAARALTRVAAEIMTRGNHPIGMSNHMAETTGLKVAVWLRAAHQGSTKQPLLTMNFICLATFNQRCCRQKGKSTGSSFSPFWRPACREALSKASSQHSSHSANTDQQQETWQTIPQCGDRTGSTFQCCRTL